MMRGFALMVLVLGCSAPKPASFEVSEVRVFEHRGTSQVQFVVLPFDEAGQAITLEAGSVDARIVEGSNTVCSGRMLRPRGFGPTHPVVRMEEFGRCLIPLIGAAPRELEAVLTVESVSLTTRAPIAPDAAWIYEADGLDEESAARLAAARAKRAPRNSARELAEAAADQLDPIRRALSVVPAEGIGDAPPCELAPLGGPPGDAAPHGRLLFEPWARRLATTDGPPPPSEDPGAFVTSPVISRVVALSRPVATDLLGRDRLKRALRVLSEDGPTLRVVRAREVITPSVRGRAGQFDFEAGRFAAVVFVVDGSGPTLVCASEVQATNSVSIMAPSPSGGSLEQAIQTAVEDLQLQALRQLERVHSPNTP